ncbi:hypothetical protein C0Q70_15755 [Pomacea canaliculata]|uniref:acylglycerol lipase n=1 Tax=Pomacea canaliculata TaxID=400727 RepID=A0A2T7NVR6_POMCA|nr:hypothetical protein C0Q70_15755 [Pomacea canaliculata]
MSLSVTELLYGSFLDLQLLNPASLMLATATAVTSLIYFMCPRLLVQMYFRVAVMWSGMRLKRVIDNKGFTFFYGERGHPKPGQTSMLLLHGFSADHFMWASIVQYLPSEIHVIALDLPGHGFTSDPLEGDDIGFKGQLQRIKQFLDLVGIDKCHVTGVSMGNPSRLFAASFQDRVSAVTMCCPSMKTPEDGQLIALYRAATARGISLTLDTCPLLPQTAADLQAMLRVVCYYHSFVPSQILKGAVELRKERNNFYLQLLHKLLLEESRSALENQLDKIICPSQVVHVSGAEVAAEESPNYIMPVLYHAVDMLSTMISLGTLLKSYQQFWMEAAK